MSLFECLLVHLYVCVILVKEYNTPKRVFTINNVYEWQQIQVSMRLCVYFALPSKYCCCCWYWRCCCCCSVVIVVVVMPFVAVAANNLCYCCHVVAIATIVLAWSKNEILFLPSIILLKLHAPKHIS